MENVCKPPIEEKHYTYTRMKDSKSREEGGRGEVKNVECKSNLLKKTDDIPKEDVLEMPPPPYPDLGKRARSIFDDGYHFGLIKLDVKTKTAGGIEFNTGGVSDQEAGKVTGFLETKYLVKEYGITFSEKWNTDNILGAGISVQDQGLKGLRLSGDINFSPDSGYKSSLISAAFANERVALNADANLDSEKPLIGASAVVGYQGWLAGYQGGYDTQNSKFKKNNFALGFSTADFVLHTCVNNDSDDGQEFGGSIYQRINPKLETAIQMAWSSGGGEDESSTKFGIGAKYDLDQDASIRAKINNASELGLGYQQRLRDGVTLTLSTMINGKSINEGGHKIGLALELEA